MQPDPAQPSNANASPPCNPSMVGRANPVTRLWNNTVRYVSETPFRPPESALVRIYYMANGCGFMRLLLLICHVFLRIDHASQNILKSKIYL